MELSTDKAGYYVAAVACRGQTRCRISLNTRFESAEDAEAALAIKARLWIAEVLQRERTDPRGPPA